MKLFSKQFKECHDEGFHKVGEVQKWKDHPELLPALWHPARLKVMELLKEDPDAGLNPILCLRFGGECESGHPECQKMRGHFNKSVRRTKRTH